MIVLYTATIFLGALLLFSIQPMIGKMLLPRLGGSPALWNTCMVFFQAALLAGYGYAHGTARLLGTRRQSILHALVLLTSFVVLPIAIGADFNPATDANPMMPLLVQLAVSVGLPFFAVSAGAPLFQDWFSRTNDPAAKDPYFLYAASNLGSLIALVAYPLLIEPRWGLDAQARLWMMGYAGLVTCAVLCAVMLRFAPATTTAQPAGRPVIDESPVTMRRRLQWIALSFVPSSLMLGVTTHVTTDIAAVPLLWVAPLALYLLTFVIAFARRRVVSTAGASWLMPYLFLPLALLTYADLRLWSWLLAGAHMFAFFVGSLTCHCRLVDNRPSARRLTDYYLMISIGGVLGGLFNAVVAPMLFSRILEYPLMLVIVCLMRPAGGAGLSTSWRARLLDWAWPVGLAGLGAGLVHLFDQAQFETWWVILVVLFAVPAMICFAFKDRPIRFALGFGAILLSLGLWREVQEGGLVWIHRNFFGVKRVLLDNRLELMRLYHGVTQHGLQSTRVELRRDPLSYYDRTGPFGELFAAYEGSEIRTRVAVLGLGTGAIATYAGMSDRYTFYEIDPAVARVAEDPDYFTYLNDCRGHYDIVLGDGRRMLEQSPEHEYGIIVADAFSSDAVPTHLITREAVELYLSRLRPGGVLVMHISNRYLSFEPMLANLAAELNLTALSRVNRISARDQDRGLAPSHWLVMATSDAGVERLADRFGWDRLRPSPGVPVWTDQFCDIVSLFLKK